MARRAAGWTAAPSAGGDGGRTTVPLLHLYFVWALTLFDFQFFLAETVAQPLVYLVYLGYPPLLLMMALQGPMILLGAQEWTWYPPLLLLLAAAIVGAPMAENLQLVRQSTQPLLIYYAVAVGTAVYIRTARQALPVVAMVVLQFAWYGAFARASGTVPWHSTLANHDGFGALMVSGVGMCYWFASAVRNRKVKLLLYVLTAYCVVGVVASYARAAFLTLLALAGWVWIRSRRKLLTAASIGAAGFVVVVAAALIFDPGFFYSEIMSAFEEGTDEGTGGQRWELWKVALRVFAARPILGAGAGNFGAFAATHFRPGELEAFPNPGVLYGFNLHNGYMQVLSELGLGGALAFAWAIWDFARRNREIRTRAAAERWEKLTGGGSNLRYLALGLEAANIANLMGALFYASLLSPWFYTTWMANRMLWAVTREPRAVAAGRRGRRLLPPRARPQWVEPGG